MPLEVAPCHAGARPTALDRARRAAAELLVAYQDARDTTEREGVAAVIAQLTPHGARPLAELAAEALAAARSNYGDSDDDGPQSASQSVLAREQFR
jgi:hypothetical protein